MVAHWPCDEEGDGNTLYDHSVNKYDGVINGAKYLADSGHSGFGGALHFDSGNSVTVNGFPAATKSWSVSLWVRPATWALPADSNSSYYITLISTEIVSASGKPGAGWEMNGHLPAAPQLEDSRDWEYHFAYPKSGDASPYLYSYVDCNCLDPYQWTHLVAVVDSDTMQLSFYKNGQQQVQQVITEVIRPPLTDTGTSPLYMGSWSGGRYFTGDLDDIVIFSRALTLAEVGSLYAQPALSVPR
jgi:hypothetical protein